MALHIVALGTNWSRHCVAIDELFAWRASCRFAVLIVAIRLRSLRRIRRKTCRAPRAAVVSIWRRMSRRGASSRNANGVRAINGSPASAPTPLALNVEPPHSWPGGAGHRVPHSTCGGGRSGLPEIAKERTQRFQAATARAVADFVSEQDARGDGKPRTAEFRSGLVAWRSIDTNVPCGYQEIPEMDLQNPETPPFLSDPSSWHNVV